MTEANLIHPAIIVGFPTQIHLVYFEKLRFLLKEIPWHQLERHSFQLFKQQKKKSSNVYISCYLTSRSNVHTG